MNKIGLDDYLASGKGVDDLLALASEDLRPPAESEAGDAQAGPYRETDAGLVWDKSTQHGPIETPLTNFTARITEQTIEDDGAEKRRLVEMAAKRDGKETCFRIAAAEFDRMAWAMEQLGSSAVVYPGFGLKGHAQVAIQMLSGDPPERRIYTHLGWRQTGDTWVYLHAGGAIGAAGPMAGVEVCLPSELANFILPTPPTGAELLTAIRSSLRLLETADDVISVPLYAATWRAAISSANFSVHLVGPTGEGKSVEAALHQQHWGAAMNYRHLPGSWLSTANALEALAFIAKDALFVVDDFLPTGTATDAARRHRDADRLLRAQGNRSGRQRMRSDTTLRPAKVPRGMIVSTGEEVPRGQSLGARILTLELSPGMLDWKRVTDCQRDAEAGLYAACMAGFVCWLAGRYREIVGPHGWLQATAQQLRQASTQSAQHRRTPDMVAQLGAGLQLFLWFCQDIGALAAEQATTLWLRGWPALGEVAALQSAHQADSEPAQLYLRLLCASIASGRAHLAGAEGRSPETPEIWGWRRRENGHESEWLPQGNLIGWVDGENVYLQPEAAYAAAESLARGKNESMPCGIRTLHKRLFEKGLLASTEQEKRGTLTVRPTLAGTRRVVLHLRADSLMPRETDQTAPSDHEPCAFASPVPRETPPELTPLSEPAEDDQGRKVVSADRDLGSLGRLGSSVAEEIAIAVEAHAVDSAPVELSPRPECPCYACKQTRFWLSVSGNWGCAVCHPPAAPALVARWLDLNASVVGDGTAPRREDQSTD